jgi:DNA polymerase family A
MEKQDTFYTYCCKDSAVTYEINEKLDSKLPPLSKQHYFLNLALLNAFLYMELQGIRYDKEKAKQRLEEINKIIYSLQYKLDSIAAFGIQQSDDKARILHKAQETCCFKKDPTTPRKEYEEDYPKVQRLLAQHYTLSEVDCGYINTACGWSMNVKSPDYKELLYTKLGLPKQYKTDPSTKKKSLTTDAEALLEIQKKSPHPAVDLGIQIMELRTRSQMLGISADPDGRVRTSYDVVGTVTGRITSRTSPTGSGYNLQTIPDNYLSLPDGHPLRQGMRDLFLADEGYYMFQCDLKGSDGWTIGAHLASLGDSSMLDDLRTGIKPAARICYMLRHGNSSLLGKTREEVKELLKEIKKDDWDYFSSKVGIWGICYLMGPDLLARQIAEESYGKVWLSRSEVKDFHNAVFTGYNVRLWHRWMENSLNKKPELLSPSGHLRRFFDRKESRLGQALAHEPQSVTTYATNLAAYKLWTDKENRETMDKVQMLRIKPLHQVHDALIGEFKIEDTSWAIGRIKSYFLNEIIIAGIPITIPFDGSYGESWGNLNKGII